jgi:hypothetical protein
VKIPGSSVNIIKGRSVKEVKESEAALHRCAMWETNAVIQWAPRRGMGGQREEWKDGNKAGRDLKSGGERKGIWKEEHTCIEYGSTSPTASCTAEVADVSPIFRV